MTDFQAGLDKALYDRLTSQIGDVQTFSHVPQDKSRPLIAIASVTGEAAGGKSAGLDRVIVSVQCETHGPTRRPVTLLKSRIRAALENWTPAITLDVEISSPVYLGEDTFRLEDDDIYFGIVRFLVFLQPG